MYECPKIRELEQKNGMLKNEVSGVRRRYEEWHEEAMHRSSVIDTLNTRIKRLEKQVEGYEGEVETL